jgi:hypothetical protein
MNKKLFQTRMALVILFMPIMIARPAFAKELITHQAFLQCESADRKTTVEAAIPGDNRDTAFIVKIGKDQVALMNESLSHTLAEYHAPELLPFASGRIVNLRAAARNSINYGWHVLADAYDQNQKPLLKLRSIEGTEKFEKVKHGRAGEFSATIQIGDERSEGLGEAQEVHCLYHYFWL